MNSNDPYLVVRSEVEASLQSALALHGSFRRIAKTLPPSSHASSEELNWSRDELKGTLSALESDLDELESSVDVVVRNPAGFGVTSDEIQRRRQFISRVRGELAEHILLQHHWLKSALLCPAVAPAKTRSR